MYERLAPHSGHVIMIDTFVDDDGDDTVAVTCASCDEVLIIDYDFGPEPPNYNHEPLDIDPASVAGMLDRRHPSESQVRIPDDLRSLFE